MCHFEVFLLESSAKQGAYMNHTLTSELSVHTFQKSFGAIENFVPQKHFQKLIFVPGIL